MKRTFFRRQILSLTLLVGCSQMLGGVAFATSSSLKDPAYHFDKTKLEAAADSFQFLRSYVDYFYLVLKANQSNLPTVTSLQNVAGWCVGDAHPENFGALIQHEGRAIFTMNDMDDSGPCPIGLDLVRLMVSSRLYKSETNIDELMNAYLKGLAGETFEAPSAIFEILKKSQKKGTAPSSKKIDGRRLVRDDSMVEVTTAELAQIKTSLQILKTALSPQTKILDVVATSKMGGGSGGLLRYEVLLDNGKDLLHLEMKEQVTPAIYPVAVGPIPETSQRIAKTIKIGQSNHPSLFYGVVQINGRDMMIRPRFDGNIGVNLKKQSDSENQEIIRYEAYTLGLIHARSIADVNSWIQQLQSLKMKNLKNDICLISEHFEARYSKEK